MFSFYQMTILEEFVESTYKRFNVTSPHQINLKELAQRLNVWVHYRPVSSRAFRSDQWNVQHVSGRPPPTRSTTP